MAFNTLNSGTGNTQIPLGGGFDWGGLLGQIGQGASSFLGSVLSPIINAGSNKLANTLFPPRDQQTQSDKLLSPFISGTQHAQYMRNAYPGTNPWEWLGGGGPSQGGVGAAQLQQQAKVAGDRGTQQATRDAAGISSLPALKKVEWETPSVIAKNTAQAHLMEAQAGHEPIKEQLTGQHIIHQKETNLWQRPLAELERELQHYKVKGQYAINQQTRAHIVMLGQQFLTEIQKSGIAVHDKEIKKVLAEWAQWITGGKLAGGAAAGLSILFSFRKLLPAGVTTAAGGVANKIKGLGTASQNIWKKTFK